MAVTNQKARETHIVSVQQAANLMRKGKLIIFPTETFFGLGSSIINDDGAQQIFKAKRRSINAPLPLIIGNWEQLSMIAEVSKNIYLFLEHFWPGPLSIILKAKACIPNVITAHTKKISVRLSSHPIACHITELVGGPIIATSANISGTAPVSCIEHIDNRLYPYISGIINIPPAPIGGLPSTVIELQESGMVTILREGAISKDAIRKKIVQLFNSALLS